MYAISAAKAREINKLAKAGATHRQIARLVGVAKNTVIRHLLLTRSELETPCSHGEPLWRCTYCRSRQHMKPLNELYAAIGLPVIWNVWVKRTDGTVYLYRTPLDRRIAEQEAVELKNADPRCQIADAWFNRWHPDIHEGVPV